MDPGILRRTRGEIVELAKAGLDWVSFATRATDVLRRSVLFDKSCWHTVDPGTVLITGSLNLNIGCSGSWLAEHEYVLDDVNKFSYLAKSGYRAGSLSQATHGNLSLSARARDSAAMGHPIGDELRGAFVADGSYWGGGDFIRDPKRPFFTDEEVRFLASLSSPLADGLRRAILAPSIHIEQASEDAPGLIVLGPHGDLVSISSQAERWIGELVEQPPLPIRTRLGRSRPLRPALAMATRAANPISLPGSGPRRGLGVGSCCTGRGCRGSWRIGLRSSSNPRLPMTSPRSSRRPTVFPSRNGG